MNEHVNYKIPVIPSLDPSLFVDMDIFSQKLKEDPVPFFLDWSTKPPFYAMVEGRPQVVICRYDQLRWALTHPEFISAVPRKGWGADLFDYFNGLPIVLEFDPPESSRLRRLMQPGFTARRVSQLQVGIDNLVDKMIKRAADAGRFDVMTDLAQPFVYELLLGVVFEFPEHLWPIFANFSKAMELVATVPVGDPKPAEYMLAYNAARDFCVQLIEERRRSPKDDLVGTVIAAHDDSGLITVEELFSTLITLFAGGISTVSGTISLSLLQLCRYPDQLNLLQEDPSLLNSAVEECLRTNTVSAYHHRYVAKDHVIDGTPLYEGMIVQLSFGAANYDSSIYPDPARFDVTRNARDIASFGHGNHFCPGQAMARSVVRNVIGKFVASFPNLRLEDPGAKVEFIGVPQERTPHGIIIRVD